MIKEEDQVAALVKIFMSIGEIALDGSPISIKVPIHYGDEESTAIMVEKGGLEHFVWANDVRHGVEGYRVLRYLKANMGDALYNWDENYQFYRTLEEFALAVHMGDYDKGCMEF